MTEVGPCPNCGRAWAGPFCAECGQRRRGRLSIRELGADLLSHVFGVDSALSRTVAGLARNPGALCRDYVAGRRARYVNPLRYCIAALATYLLVSVLLGADPTKAIGNVVITGDSAEAAEVTRGEIARRIDLVMFLALPLFALLLRGYYRKAGYNYAEIAAYTLFVVGELFLFATLLVPISLWAPKTAAGVRLAGQIVIFTWSAMVFFGGRGWSGWLKALGVQVLYVMSVLPVAVPMALYFLFTSAD